MKIEHKILDGIDVLEPEGEMRAGKNEHLLHKEVAKLIKDGRRKFVFNLEKVPFMDSAGLGSILRCYTSIRKAGGNLKLMKLTERVQEIFQVTRMSNLLDWYHDEEKALKAFSAITR
jgi:anti-sigma B factor antagonist